MKLTNAKEKDLEGSVAYQVRRDGGLNRSSSTQGRPAMTRKLILQVEAAAGRHPKMKCGCSSPSGPPRGTVDGVLSLGMLKAMCEDQGAGRLETEASLEGPHLSLSNMQQLSRFFLYIHATRH